MRSVLLCLSVFLFWTIDLRAETPARPVVEWQKVLGGTGGDIPSSVRQTADGGFIIGGNSDSGISGSKSSPAFGQGDFWLVRLDAAGTKLWDRSYGGDNWDRFCELEPTADGGFYLGGVTLSGLSGNKTQVSHAEDGWLIAVDDEGNELWQRCFGGHGYDCIDSLASAPDGGVVLGCSSTSSIGGNKSEPAFGKGDIWIVAVDVYGHLRWQKSYGGTADESGVRIRALPGGGYIVGASSTSSAGGRKATEGLGNSDYWVLCLDAKGNKLWERTLGGIGCDVLVDIKATHDGGFIVGGRSDSTPSGNKSAPAYGSDDIWLVKLNATGEILWDRSLGGNDMEFLKDVVETTDGGLLLGGESTSSITGTKTTTSAGSWDYWLIRLDDSGQELWQASYGGPGGDSYPSIVPCADGGVFVCGASDSGFGDNKTLRNQSVNGPRQDYWLLKLE